MYCDILLYVKYDIKYINYILYYTNYYKVYKYI